MKAILRWILIGIGCCALYYIYSPESAIRTFVRIIPERFLIPVLSDSTYVHTETDFFEQLKLIHGEFTVKDSCTFQYKAPFQQAIPLVVTTEGKINFYVDIDTSIIQINNDSKTFLLDTTGIELQYLVSDYHISHKLMGNLTIPDVQINAHMAQCNNYFNENIKNSKQLIAAKQSLDKLINSQLIFLIQKGYVNRNSR